MSVAVKPTTTAGATVETAEESADQHVVGQSAANTAQNLDVAAPSGTLAVYVTSIEVAWTGTAPAAPVIVTLESPNGTVKKRLVFTAALGGREIQFARPLKMADATQVRLAVPAGGAGAVSNASMSYFVR